MKTFHECCLYTFVDTAYLHGREASEIARELCAGGSDIVQLRAKNESTETILRLAEAGATSEDFGALPKKLQRLVLKSMEFV